MGFKHISNMYKKAKRIYMYAEKRVIMSYGFKVMVDGDYACFTRPEMKVERVSYDVPTPGALEGLLKSVYWKPAIRYVIDKIIVFNKVDFINIRRNEVKDKISYQAVRSQMSGKGGNPCIYTSESRSQRASLILKDVKYGVEFHFELPGLGGEEETDAEKKIFRLFNIRFKIIIFVTSNNLINVSS